jgi:GT2 family glycosyltransferase
MISVIIVSYNTAALLRRCLLELYNNAPPFEMEVLVVDNNSLDDSSDMVKREFPQVQLILNSENVGFAAANNQAYNVASGDYIVLLNPDAFIKPGCLDNVVAFMERHPKCGLSGGRLLSPAGELEPSARKFPNAWTKFLTLSGLRARFPRSSFFAGHEYGGFDHCSNIEVDWVPGTFTVYRREMLEETGLFDERFFLYYEETDLCRKAKRLGWSVYFTSESEVVHMGGGSGKTRTEHYFDGHGSQVLRFRMRSEWLYFRKNSGLLGVLSNAGIELVWHILRWLLNGLPGKENRQMKRAGSATILRELFASLRDTGFGSRSPAIPW